MTSVNDLAVLVGHTVYLRPITKEDVTDGRWHHWYNDYTLTAMNSHGVYPISVEDQLEYFLGSKGDKSRISLAVCAVKDDVVLGNVTLSDIDLLNRKAQVACTIGEQRELTAGLEAIGLITAHGFRRLNLNKVWGGAHEGLEKWVKMLEVLGFQNEGVLEQEFLRDGHYSKGFRFGVLREKYEELMVERDGKYLLSSAGGLLSQASKIVSTKKT